MTRGCYLEKEFRHFLMEEAVMAVEQVLIVWKLCFDLRAVLLLKAIAADLRGLNLLDW